MHGMVHITGGGFYENLPRMYKKASLGKKQLCSVIKRGSWTVPPIFSELVNRGAAAESMFETFNMGIGFVLAVKKESAQEITDFFNKNAHLYHKDGSPDLKAYQIGFVGTTEAVQGEAKGNHALTLFKD